MRTLAVLLAVAVVAFGQDCPDTPCSKAAQTKAAITLSETIAKLEAHAAKGCETSASRLAALCRTAGVTDTKDLKARVAAYEKYAPCGCDVSKQKLAELAAVLASEPGPRVSGRVALLVAVAGKGDPKSQAVLKSLCAECCPPDCGDDDCAKQCGKECGTKLIVRIRKLEASAAEGGRESVAKLAKIETVLATLPATSSRVAELVASAAKGDTPSKALLKSLCAECCPPDCCDDDCAKQCGKDCGTELVGRVKTLEGSAARGCDTSAGKLARINAKLAGAAVSEKPAKGHCGGGSEKPAKGDCGGCPGSGGGCPQGPARQ